MAKIPKFKTDKEIAEFWDTHDLTDFEEELTPAKDIVFVKPKCQVISLRLDRDIVKALKTLAAQKGIDCSALLRTWVIERFYKESHPRHRKTY